MTDAQASVGVANGGRPTTGQHWIALLFVLLAVFSLISRQRLDDVTQRDATQLDVTQHGVTQHDVIPLDVVRHDVIQHDVIQHDVIQHAILHEVTQHDAVRYSTQFDVTQRDVTQLVRIKHDVIGARSSANLSPVSWNDSNIKEDGLIVFELR